MRPAQLKVHHVTKWHESLGVGSRTQNDAVKIVQRLLNWSVEQDYISVNPVRGMKRPKRQRRDIFYTHDQWKQIRRHANGPLVDLLDFLYMTGCRPQEARTIEARHVKDDLIIFPADESKGEREPRVIYMIPEASSATNNCHATTAIVCLFFSSCQSCLQVFGCFAGLASVGRPV